MADDSHRDETYRSLITISLEGLRTLLLLHGGALVAIGAKVDVKAPELTRSLRCPGVCFVVGLTLSALAFWGSYATQLVLYNEDLERKPQGTHGLWMVVTGALIAASLLLFLVGSVLTVSALS